MFSHWESPPWTNEGAESVNKCPSAPYIERFLRDSPGDWAPVTTAVTHLSVYLSLLSLLSHHLHWLGLCRIISQINYLQPSPEFEELLGGKPKLWQEPFSVVKWLHKGIVLYMANTCDSPMFLSSLTWHQRVSEKTQAIIVNFAT